LIVEFDALLARLIPVRMRMRVPQVELLAGDDRTLLPHLFNGLVMDGGAKRVDQDAGAGAGMKTRVEGFEALARVALARVVALRYRWATGRACLGRGSGE
jgi:hypothetical protein